MKILKTVISLFTFLNLFVPSSAQAAVDPATLELIDPANVEFVYNGGYTDRATRNITHRYILNNISGQTLEGPFTLEFVISPSGVTSVLNANDTMITGNALIYFSQTTLSPGESINYELTFANPGRTRFDYAQNLYRPASTGPGPNTAPIAADISVTGAEDQPLQIQLQGTDADGDPLSYSLLSQPQNGTLTGTAPDLTYTPDPEFNGSDSFEYSVSDGSVSSAPAVVNLTITPVNDAPVASEASFILDEDTVLSDSLVATDPDGDPLTFALSTQAANGIAVINPDGTFIYTPNTDFNGTDSFTFTASDASAQSAPSVVSFTINPINDAPVAPALSESLSAGGSVIIDLLANATDIDGPSLSIDTFTQPTHGTLTDNGDGTVTYVHDGSENFSDSFEYSITDSFVSSVLSVVNLSITPVNNSPVASDVTADTLEDTPVNIALSGSDPDGDALSFQITIPPSNGTLNVNGSPLNATLTYPLESTLTYTPSTNYSGSDTFNYILTDGFVSSVPSVVNIAIIPINDAPVASEASFILDEDTTLSDSLVATDPDGDPLNFTLSTQAANGTAVVNPDGTFTYTSNADFNGADSFTFTASDASEQSVPSVVSFTINPINDAPVAPALSESLPEGGTLTIDLLINATDIDGPTLFINALTQPTYGTLTDNNDGTITYTHDGTENFSDSFEYTLSDGSLLSVPSVVNLIINPVNAAPVANADTVTTNEDEAIVIDVLLNDSDADTGDSLSIVSIANVANGTATINPDNTITFTPDADFNGTSSFTYIAEDNNLALSEPAVVTITINPINDAPIASDASFTIEEGSTLTIDLLANATDIDGPSLSIDTLTQPTHGTLSDNGDGTVTYVHDGSENFSDSFEYSITDSFVSSVLSVVNLSITPVNNPPVSSDVTTDTLEDTPVNIALSGSDPDGDALSFQITIPPSNGTLSVNGNPLDPALTYPLESTLTYTPSTNYSGSDTFNYTISDGFVSSVPSVVNITITPDQDGDGVPDSQDDDRDGDGVSNVDDAFPDDSTESSDLDGDGIGDNADDDRDGDGFSNDEEILAGSDPDDPSDTPFVGDDTIAPTLTIDGEQNLSVNVETITITGTVTDDSSGIASVIIQSDRLANATTATIQANGDFSAQISIRTGTNNLIVIAKDRAGNETQVNLVISRTVPPQLSSNIPASGLTVNQPSITITGRVVAFDDPDSIRVRLDGQELIPVVSDESPSEYLFEFADVPLQLGANVFTLQAESLGGLTEQILTVTYQEDVPEPTPKPILTVSTPPNSSVLNKTTFELVGTVESFADSVSMTLNGQPIDFQGADPTQGNWSELLSFAAGATELPVTITATDNLGQSTTVELSYFLDVQAPIINITQPLSLPPTVNPVVDTPYILTGQLIEAHIASFTVNGQSVSLAPGAGVGDYEFSVALNLIPGQDVTVSLLARDVTGNKTQVEYILRQDDALTIQALLPEDNAEFTSGTAVSIAARVTGLSDGATTFATLVSADGSIFSGPVALTFASEIASGDLALSEDLPTDDYTIAFEVKDSAGAVLGRATQSISVQNAQQIELELLRTEPELGAQGVEPDAFIGLYFNRPIEIDKLSVTVTETAFGETYVNADAPGTDFLNAKGYVIEEVSRNRVPVVGNLSLLPGDTVVAFYPEEVLSYGANIEVEVTYDGVSLSRFAYDVRSLPTFMNGGVVDQLNQTVAGVEISIPELGRTTVTNSEGGFSFGFGDTADQALPGGRYIMVLNPDRKDPRFAEVERYINIQQGRRNNLGRFLLPILNDREPFRSVSSGDSEVILGGGDLRIDLTGVTLLFPDGQDQGMVHVQFTPFNQIALPIAQIVFPFGLFAVQPAGIEVLSGDPIFDFVLPSINGDYTGLPEDGTYALILGVDKESLTIAPVGVGFVQDYRVITLSPLALERLDYIGYAFVEEEDQELLESFAQGNITLQELIARLSQ